MKIHSLPFARGIASRGRARLQQAHCTTAVKLPWVLEFWKKAEATGLPNDTTPETLNVL